MHWVAEFRTPVGYRHGQASAAWRAGVASGVPHPLNRMTKTEPPTSRHSPIACQPTQKNPRHWKSPGRGLWLLALATLGVAGSVPAGTQQAHAAGEVDRSGQMASPQIAKPAIRIPEQALPTMAVDTVRPGMTGYGLSTFNGTRIERFPVEVVSIEYKSGPGQALIWVRCTGERMQESGPVQGMSGSPIFLYPDAAAADAAGEDGRGGLLIGAFAYGMAMTNDCMVGVQPVAYMRDVGSRAELPAEDAASTTGSHKRSAAHDPLRPARVAAVLETARRSSLPAPEALGNAGLAADVLRHLNPAAPGGASAEPAGVKASRQAMRVPMQVGSPLLAGWLDPVAEGLGLPVVATSASASGAVPPHVVAADTRLEPGAAFAVPLAFGDWVPSITGTVTEVMPDGTVLGFGHPMDGLGEAALPMATGYTHFIASLITISHKVSGALEVQGSLVRDEFAAVAGVPGDAGLAFTTAPLNVQVRLPGREFREYRYEVVNHPSYSPMITSAAAVQSLIAQQSPPLLSTTRLSGDLRFTDGTSFRIDSRIPFGQPFAVFMQLMPLLSTMMDNDFSPVEMAGGELRMEVTDGVELASISNASVQPATARAGEAVTVTIELRPYGGEPYRRNVVLELPSDARPGEYAVVISGAEGHLARLLTSRPDLARVRSFDHLVGLFQTALSLPGDRVYVDLLNQNETGVAIGRSELPTLPSSQLLLLGVPGSNASATPILPMSSAHLDTPEVVSGSLTLNLNINDPATAHDR